MRSSRSRSAAGLLAIPVLITLLAGCMSATTPDTSGSSAPENVTSEQDFSSERDAYDLKLAECLRGMGFEVADPKPGEGITEDAPGISEAAGQCTAQIGAPPVNGTPPSEAEMLQTGLKEAACFRERGFEVEDPSLGQQYVLPAEATQEDFDACFQRE